METVNAESKPNAVAGDLMLLIFQAITNAVRPFA